METRTFYCKLYDTATHSCRIINDDSPEWGSDKSTEIIIEHGYIGENPDYEYDKMFAIMLLYSCADCLMVDISGKDVPNELQGVGVTLLNTSDVFAWGYSNADYLKLEELPELFDFWVKDKVFGTTVWWCIHEKRMPQQAIANDIKERGIWNLADYNLEPNEN